MRYGFLLLVLVLFHGTAISGERGRSYLQVNGQTISLLYSEATTTADDSNVAVSEPQQVINLLAEIHGLLEQVLALMAFWAGLFLWRLFILCKSQRNLI